MVYLNMATTTRDDVLQKLDRYKITERPTQPREQSTHKYTHKETGLFIILTDEGKQICSFGGKYRGGKNKRKH